jgi:arabinose-5-phosphate isomerase
MAGRPDHLPTIARVIGEEAAALTALASALDKAPGAVDLLLAVTGRVIVSGMGKSGHIARKIAATFASTGTPAHFVHPAEASHGDLGMMARGDVVLALSNSGETPELAALLSHVKRFGIPLIAMTARADSTLARAADLVLILPPMPEACGIGIVPTTSTTMMLALGDALAIALMQARDFGPDHFRAFHPGGRLGARLARVRDLMHVGDEVPLAALRTPMSDALLTMSQRGFGVVGVLDDDGILQGIVTDGDLRRHMDGLLGRTAGDVMTPAPRVIAPDQLAEQALALMQDRKITCLFVVDPPDSGRVAGILHIHDCLRAGVA